MGAWGVYPLLPSGNILLSDMQSGLYVFEGPGDNCYATQQLASLEDPCASPTAVFESNVISGLYPQPVPAGQTIKISFREAPALDAEIELRDLNGRSIHSWNIQPGYSGMLELTVPAWLNSGLYLLEITRSGRKEVRKVEVLGR
jgi:hypothetical protein